MLRAKRRAWQTGSPGNAGGDHEVLSQELLAAEEAEALERSRRRAAELKELSKSRPVPHDDWQRQLAEDKRRLTHILLPFFAKYDLDGNGQIDLVQPPAAAPNR